MGKYWRTNFWYNVVKNATKLPICHKFNYYTYANDIKPPFVVLCNHTTDYDAFFVAYGFKSPIHFVMSDHISSIPVVGKIVTHFLSPILITKSTSDLKTTKQIFETIKNGGSVGIFPEGNKSLAGGTSAIKPSIAKLLKKLNVPVVIFNIEGGYLSSPRWSKSKRKGNVNGFVKRTIMPEELAELSSENLLDIINTSLNVNAYNVQSKKKIKYLGKDLASGIENLLYFCPKCGQFSTIYGSHDQIRCKNCDLICELDEYGFLYNCKFDRLDEWDAWQKNKLKQTKFNTSQIVGDSGIFVKKKISNTKNKNIGKFDIALFSDKLILSNDNQKITINLSDIVNEALEGANGIQLWLKNGDVLRLTNKNNISGLKYINAINVLTGSEIKF